MKVIQKVKQWRIERAFKKEQEKIRKLSPKEQVKHGLDTTKKKLKRLKKLRRTNREAIKIIDSRIVELEQLRKELFSLKVPYKMEKSSK